MPKSNEPSDAKILDRLRRSRGPRTAADLGTTSARLRKLAGVVAVGKVKTGKAGRPSILFTTEDQASLSQANNTFDQDVTTSPEAAAREGTATVPNEE